MRPFKILARSLLLVPLLALASAPAWSLSVNEKAGLQAAMQTYVDQQLVDGVFLYLDTKTGDTLKLHPVTAHPAMFTMGNRYVLCFDFRDDKGQPVNLDLYMARKGASYVVFHTEVNDHQMLQRFVDEGKAKTAE
ncbi:MAG TPA: hypothetical protein VMQ11_16715 [Alphaproteobacteria bacterium]|nr:hypothetical protein [Alphaproteobacteria bacterium]